MAVEKQFVERMRELLVNLPYDMKVLFEAITDEDLPVEARQVAAGGLIYCLSPADPIPDHTGLVGFADDAIFLRLVLKRLLGCGGDGVAGYPDRFAEQFAQLDEDIALFRAYLGDAMGWLEQRTGPPALQEAKYKGKSTTQYVDSDELSQLLYEDGLAFTTEYELDDDAVQRLTSGRPVLDAFTKRRQFEQTRRGG